MKTIFSLIIGLLMAGSINAQDRAENRGEKLEAQRIAFFTKKLDLTPQEAEKFWPLYNEHRKMEKDLRSENRSDHKRPNDMSEQEAEQIIEKLLSYEESQIALKRDFYKKLKGVIPVKKVAMLHMVDKRFREQVINSFRSHRQNKKKRGER